MNVAFQTTKGQKLFTVIPTELHFFFLMMVGCILVLLSELINQLMHIFSSYMYFMHMLQTVNAAQCILEWLPQKRPMGHLIFLPKVGGVVEWKSLCCSQIAYVGIWTSLLWKA